MTVGTLPTGTIRRMTKYLSLITAVLLIAGAGALAVAHQAGTIGLGCMAMMRDMPAGSSQPPNRQWPQHR
jgi:hypothetical protein